MTQAVAVLANVTKRYGARRAVADLDLIVRTGERIGLVGHNGAGKTTLIKLMLGLLRPTSGQIEILGEDVTRRTSVRARLAVGYLPENIVFPPSMSGEELLTFYARLKRQPLSANRELLERVGIAHAAKHRVATYSKGMRQRLGLAQALLGAPKILLLDEPTTGLDPEFREKFYEIIAELSVAGTSVVLSSHALAELQSEVDRIVVMNNGHKAADGTVQELRRMLPDPVRIAVTFVDAHVTIAFITGALDNVKVERCGPRKMEIRCRDADKMEVLRRLSTLSEAVEDVEIVTPGLDTIYTHFLAQEAAE
jgi:Cu-processing system ATP-binding protein